MNTKEVDPPYAATELNEDHWALIDAILEVNIRRKKFGKPNLERLLEVLDRLEIDNKGV